MCSKKCLSVGVLKKILNCYDDDSFVFIVSLNEVNDCCLIEDCVSGSPVNDFMSGIYLYTESAQKNIDEYFTH